MMVPVITEWSKLTTIESSHIREGVKIRCNHTSVSDNWVIVDVESIKGDFVTLLVIHKGDDFVQYQVNERIRKYTVKWLAHLNGLTTWEMFINDEGTKPQIMFDPCLGVFD